MNLKQRIVSFVIELANDQPLTLLVILAVICFAVLVGVLISAWKEHKAWRALDRFRSPKN